MENQIYIYYAKRTPIGSFLGQFKDIKAVDLTATLIKNYFSTHKNINLNYVILGQVLTCGLGQNTARQALIHGGGNYQTPALTINHVCGSGLKSVILAYQTIIAKEYENVIAGGQENMSMTNHYIYARIQKKYGDYLISKTEFELHDKMLNLKDSMIEDGLIDVFNNVLMSQTAEHLVKKFNISRESQDEFAFNSHRKANLANQNKYFEAEICSIIIKNKENNEENSIENKTTEDKEIKTDEGIRPNINIEKLKTLKPLVPNTNNNSTETVTAGNSSSLNDGSSILGVASYKFIKKNNLTPLVQIISHATIGLEPMEMGLGPIYAIEKALKLANWRIEDVDLFEINEAFASQILACILSLKIDPLIVNISGGAIALGHPIGASGARILTTLIHNLKRLGKKKGVASLCIGGGMGVAICIEVV